MKKIFYESWIAKHLLFPSYSTITLAAFVCTRGKELTQRVKNHECTHARQWVEMFVIGWFATWILQLIFGISAWWYALSFLAFYIFYLLELLIKSIILRRNAYKDISFEQEARKAEDDETYLENSDYFAWVKFLFKKA